MQLANVARMTNLTIIFKKADNKVEQTCYSNSQRQWTQTLLHLSHNMSYNVLSDATLTHHVALQEHQCFQQAVLNMRPLCEKILSTGTEVAGIHRTRPKSPPSWIMRCMPGTAAKVPHSSLLPSGEIRSWRRKMITRYQAALQCGKSSRKNNTDQGRQGLYLQGQGLSRRAKDFRCVLKDSSTTNGEGQQHWYAYL